MVHQRTVIRHAVVALLLGQTAAATRVYAARQLPVRKGELPAVMVFTNRDPVDPDSADTAPRELRRRLELVIDALVAGVDGAALEDALDAIALQIETAMAADPYLSVADVVEAINTAANTFQLTAHGLATGQGPVRPRSSGAMPAGLVRGQRYYPIVVDPNTIKLARTPADAWAGIAVDITSAGSGVVELVVGSADDSILQDSESDTDEDGEVMVGMVRLTYSVKYHTLEPQPVDSLDDFETVDARYSLGGAQAPLDQSETTFTVEAP